MSNSISSSHISMNQNKKSLRTSRLESPHTPNVRKEDSKLLDALFVDSISENNRSKSPTPLNKDEWILFFNTKMQNFDKLPASFFTQQEYRLKNNWPFKETVNSVASIKNKVKDKDKDKEGDYRNEISTGPLSDSDFRNALSQKASSVYSFKQT